MLKTTGLPDVLGPKVGNSDDEIIKFGVGNAGKELAKKSRKSKSQNLAKSQKSSKSEKSKGKNSKKLSKIGNSSNFNAIEARPSFLTPEVRETFNCL